MSSVLDLKQEYAAYENQLINLNKVEWIKLVLQIKNFITNFDPIQLVTNDNVIKQLQNNTNYGIYEIEETEVSNYDSDRVAQVNGKYYYVGSVNIINLATTDFSVLPSNFNDTENENEIEYDENPNNPDNITDATEDDLLGIF